MEDVIAKKALELGYESCGIIGTGEMSGFADKLRERIEESPPDEGMYKNFFGYANLHETYPWAKSLVVCVVKYVHYIIPKNLDGMIGKNYLVDVRSGELGREYGASNEFENFLKSLGLQVSTERRFGVTAMRWAALKAGLGIVRKNNFFYSDSGSWVHVEAFLTDKEMELVHKPVAKPCPPDCNRCITACPTKSLSKPYTMSPAACISPLSVRPGIDMTNSPYRQAFGKWVYGCDTCQDVCPFNAGKWKQTDAFPGLAELSAEASLENIVRMDETRLTELFADKFFYIGREQIWRWKINALNAMLNSYDASYADTIKAAQNDPNEQVRRMADFVAKQVL